MRVSFLLVLVPAVALGDASTPGKASKAPEPQSIEYWLDEGAKTPHCAPACDAKPIALEVDGQRVTIRIDPSDYKIHVNAVGGELVLEAAGQGFMSRKGGNVIAELAPGKAPVTLVHLSSRPEACSDFWDVYVSVVGGVPREALSLFGLADPPSMSSSTAKFSGDGAVVTTRTAEDETHTRTKRTRYRWNGSVYVESKRSASSSK